MRVTPALIVTRNPSQNAGAQSSTSCCVTFDLDLTQRGGEGQANATGQLSCGSCKKASYPSTFTFPRSNPNPDGFNSATRYTFTPQKRQFPEQMKSYSSLILTSRNPLRTPDILKWLWDIDIAVRSDNSIPAVEEELELEPPRSIFGAVPVQSRAERTNQRTGATRQQLAKASPHNSHRHSGTNPHQTLTQRKNPTKLKKKTPLAQLARDNWGNKRRTLQIVQELRPTD